MPATVPGLERVPAVLANRLGTVANRGAELRGTEPGTGENGEDSQKMRGNRGKNA